MNSHRSLLRFTWRSLFGLAAAMAALLLLGSLFVSPAGAAPLQQGTPPDTAITATPANPTNSAAASFSFTGSSGAAGDPIDHFECGLDSAAYSLCSNPQAYSGLAQGSHSFSVRAVDAAGESDPTPAFYTWTVDLTPPETTIDTHPSSLSNTRSFEFSYSATDNLDTNATVTFYYMLAITEFPGTEYWWKANGHLALGIVPEDGVHSFGVYAVDSAGNADPTPAFFTWTIDTTPPAVTINQASGQPDPTAASPINFTAQFSEPVTGFDGSDITLSGTAGATTATVTEIAPFDGAAYNVAVSGITTYGTVAASINSGKVQDTIGYWNTASTSTDNTVAFIPSVPPDTAFASTPPTFSNSSTAVFAFTGTDDLTPPGSLTFQCSSHSGPWTACTSPVTWTGLTEGYHSLDVSAVDGDNQIDPTPASTYLYVDLTPPDTSIIVTPPALTNVATADFQLTGEDLITAVDHFECSLDAAVFAACSATLHYSGLADGSHTFAAQAVDRAGNVDPTPASFTWTVDTTPPVPAIDTFPPAVNNLSVFNFTFSATDNLSPYNTFYCYLYGNGDGIFAVNCSSPFAVETLIDKTYTFQVYAIDAAGNWSSNPAEYTWRVDTTAPAVTINQAAGQADPAAAGPINFTAQFSERVTGFDGSDVTLTGSAGATTATVSEIAPFDGSTYNVAVSGMAAAGTVTAAIPAGGAQDAMGYLNFASTSADNTVTLVDLAPPDTTIYAHPPAITNNEHANFTFNGSDNFTSSGYFNFECQLDGAGYTSCDGQAVYSPVDGVHTFEVRAIDQAGNVDPTPASFTWMIDTSAPDTNITAHPSDPAGSSSASFSFTGSDGAGSGVASFECALDSGAFATCSSPHSYTGLVDGNHTFQVRAMDAAANADPTPDSFTWRVNGTAPAARVINGACTAAGNASGSITLLLADAGGDPISLTLASNSNPALIPNAAIVIAGSGNQRTISVASAAKASGEAALTFNLNDGVSIIPLVITVKVGTNKTNILNGGEGIDMLFGNKKADILNGEGGDDLLCGGNGADNLNGGDGNDILDGGKGNDRLDGGAGNDILRGNAGGDRLTGGAGADLFSGGPGNDIMIDFTPADGDVKDSLNP